MKTASVSYPHLPVQNVYNLLLAIIVLAMPAANFSDIEYYKVLVTDYYKNFTDNYF